MDEQKLSLSSGFECFSCGILSRTLIISFSQQTKYLSPSRSPPAIISGIGLKPACGQAKMIAPNGSALRHENSSFVILFGFRVTI